MSESEKGGTNSQMEMRNSKSRRSGRRRKRLENEIRMLRRTGQQQRKNKWRMEGRLRRRLHRGCLGGLVWVVWFGRRRAGEREV
jgi:hypothetical protein